MNTLHTLLFGSDAFLTIAHLVLFAFVAIVILAAVGSAVVSIREGRPYLDVLTEALDALH